MEEYRGQTPADQITGGGSWVAEHGTGHEVCNFLPVDGQVYGYVQAQGQGINLSRLGAESDTSHMDGVTVVWTARRPNVGTVIIGWYENARVFSSFQDFGDIPPIQAKNGIKTYLIRALESDATILGMDARTKDVPRQTKGGMGQSNVWYIDQPEVATFRAEVEALIHAKHVRVVRVNARTKPDQAQKLLVEAAAIALCWAHYEALDYTLSSVEKDNLGWDLEASSGKTRLRIEVKGLSGSSKQIELSPNEYVAFAAEADDYRLAVVSNALASPTLAIARYSSEFQHYIVEVSEDTQLDIRLMTGAVVRFV